jgi:diguanylate cyclase (GGDEF)-like protein/PAS domain S-box-containing protein
MHRRQPKRILMLLSGFVIAAAIVVIISATSLPPALSELGQSLLSKAFSNIYLTASILVILAITIGFSITLRRLSQEHTRTKNRLAHEKLRLDTAINNMSQGLLLFDSLGCIVVCNQRYIEMYGLSADLVKPGITFRDLIQHRKDCGTFEGDIDRYHSLLLENLARKKVTELTIETPDKRSIRIINKPLENGGWVATHEDITDQQRLVDLQKRSEETAREQQLLLDLALNNMHHGLCVFDAVGRIVLFNGRYAELMEQSPDKLQGLSLLELFIHRKANGAFLADPEEFFSQILKNVREGKTTTKEMVRMDGTTLRVIDQPMQDGGWVATYEDITEQRRAERERDRNRAFLDLIIENVPSAIFVKSAKDRKYVLVNTAGERFWGISRQAMIGKTVVEILPEAEARKIEARDNQLLETGEPVFDEREIVTPDDGLRSILSRRLMIRDESDAAQYVLGVVDDVTERKIAESRIARLAHYDSLTDLPNRLLFREQLEKELFFVRRGSQLAVLYLDLDHFKSINDTLGHPAGDELLKEVAKRLRSCLRETDLIARLGGDEFAIVQTDLKHAKDAEALAQRLREAVTATAYDLHGHHTITDLSVGIALAPGDGTDFDELIKHADLALYGAKTEGRASYRYFEPEMNARIKHRREIETDLRSALSDGAFELYYQPLVNLQTGAIAGCEALIRWNHPRRGMVEPSSFILVAEETGLINPIGEWVIKQACAEAMNWPKHLNVSVNVSPVQLRNPAFNLIVAGALGTSGLAARRLELEVTESVLMQNNEATLATLHQIKDLGVRISLDDFGTGYSSLSYLRSFPFDKLKIDRSFVSDLCRSNGAKPIIQAILDLARSLKMTTTAEGVETLDQKRMLETMGCNEMQGYLFSLPRPAAEVLPLLVSPGRSIDVSSSLETPAQVFPKAQRSPAHRRPISRHSPR